MTNTNILHEITETTRIQASGYEKQALATAYAGMLDDAARDGRDDILRHLLTKATGGAPYDLQAQEDGSLRDADYILRDDGEYKITYGAGSGSISVSPCKGDTRGRCANVFVKGDTEDAIWRLSQQILAASGSSNAA